MNHYFMLRENKPNQTQFQTQPLSAPKTPQFLRIFYNFYQFLRATCAFGAKIPSCHPERSEGSVKKAREADSTILHFDF